MLEGHETGKLASPFELTRLVVDDSRTRDERRWVWATCVVLGRRLAIERHDFVADILHRLLVVVLASDNPDSCQVDEEEDHKE